MFDYLTKTSIINLCEFAVNSINCIVWESNLSIKTKKKMSTQFQRTQTSQRDLVERWHTQ